MAFKTPRNDLITWLAAGLVQDNLREKSNIFISSGGEVENWKLKGQFVLLVFALPSSHGIIVKGN